MAWQGMPDFEQPISSGDLQILYPYQGSGSHVLLPDNLEIGQLNDGRPDFLLQLVRPQNPLFPPEPYGLLSFHLEPHYRMDEGLTLLRDQLPGATLQGGIFASGFLRFLPVADTLPAELEQPVALSWNGLGNARFMLKLTLDHALLLKGALQSDALTFLSIAEMELAGISPRLPLHVHFDPAKLLNALLLLGNDLRQVARDDIVDYFRKTPQGLPFEIVGDMSHVVLDDFAQVMTDHVRARFGSFIPAPTDDGRPYLVLASPSDIGSGSFDWDLSEPLLTMRPLVLTLHPLEAIRAVAKEHGIDTLVQEVVVPPIMTGFLPVTITANIPSNRVGVSSLGVTLHAPPHPPQRPQAIIQSVGFRPPDDTASLLLQFSPIEKQEYLYATFVTLIKTNSVEQLNSAEVPHTGNLLNLGPDDFPVDFVALEAASSLVALAVINGTCHWLENGVEAAQSFTLTDNQPAIAIALPKGTEGATLTIQASAKDGSKTLSRDPVPARNLRLGLYSFPEYGPHKITVTCIFHDTTPLYSIDLLPEGRSETPDTITVLHFTPDQPVKEWSWFALSPFQAGYCYRQHTSSTGLPALWSAVLSPFENLIIQAQAEQGGAT